MQLDEPKQITIPFVFGSIAFPLAKKSDDCTHKWACYLRGVNNQNLSYLISKVIFHLHPSCGNPVRETSTYPFQIQQFGWGEFEIFLDVHFTIPDYPVVRLVHQLKLHHTHTGSSQVTKKPLCSQAYDQFVFSSVNENLSKVLLNRPQINYLQQISQQIQPQSQQTFSADQPLKSITNYSRYFVKFEPNDHKVKLQDAIRFINSQILILTQRMKIIDGQVQKIYEQITNKL